MKPVSGTLLMENPGGLGWDLLWYCQLDFNIAKASQIRRGRTPQNRLDTTGNLKTVTLRRIRASCGQPPLCDYLTALICKESILNLMVWDHFKKRCPNVCPDLFARLCLPDLSAKCCFAQIVSGIFPANNIATIEDPTTVTGS